MTSRRSFIMLLGGAAAAWPMAGRAQQARRVGVLMGLDDGDPEGQSYAKTFAEGLQELGWTAGRNLEIDYRWGGSDRERIRQYASELIGLRPDVILAQTSLVMPILRQATSTIPIVFMQINDPVESGMVATLARPGGNITGFMSFELTVGGKWLQTLKEIAPTITRAAVIMNPRQSPQVAIWRSIEAVAPAAGVELIQVGAQDFSEIERAIDGFAREPNGGVIVLPNPITNVNRTSIFRLAVRKRLPAVYAYRYFVVEGGLVSYGADVPALYRRAAGYVDRILRGEKPAQLPVQAPTKYGLVVNLKAARAIGLSVPESFLLRADEVIE